MKQYVSQMLEKINACIFIIQSSIYARDINNMLFLSLIYAHAYISFVNYKGSILKFILQGWGSQYQLSLVKCDKLCKLFQIRRVGDMHGETYSKIRRICVHYFTPTPPTPREVGCYRKGGGGFKGTLVTMICLNCLRGIFAQEDDSRILLGDTIFLGNTPAYRILAPGP